MSAPANHADLTPPATSAWEVFRIFLVLGLTSFGGPVAHMGYYRNEFVEKRRWLDEHAFADLMALCQFLPGPASSQVATAIGHRRAGFAGAIAALAAFTLPSAIALVLFAQSLATINASIGTAWLHGLKIVAVAVVAQALWGMGRMLCPDRPRATIAIGSAVVALSWPSAAGQVAAIAAAGLVALALLPASAAVPSTSQGAGISRRTGAVLLALFGALLVGLPLAAAVSDAYALALFDSFYRAGSLVFGGGHVVLPLLQAEVVRPGWVGNDTFLAGYGMAQAIPGPLFAFAAFLGAASTQSPAGWTGATIALVAIFLPGFLLVLGALPFWDRLRHMASMRRAMLGINAAVVGLLLAAFYDPVWTSAILGPRDFAIALAAFLALAWWKVPPWAVVIASALVAALAGG